MPDLLDNITWFTLSGPHAHFAAARRLYLEMGFRDYCETTLRIISRC
jgi:hypothetical protein